MNLLTGPFSGLNDPGLNDAREKANVYNPLTNVSVIAVAAAIAGRRVTKEKDYQAELLRIVLYKASETDDLAKVMEV